MKFYNEGAHRGPASWEGGYTDRIEKALARDMNGIYPNLFYDLTEKQIAEVLRRMEQEDRASDKRFRELIENSGIAAGTAGSGTAGETSHTPGAPETPGSVLFGKNEDRESEPCSAAPEDLGESEELDEVTEMFRTVMAPIAEMVKRIKSETWFLVRNGEKYEEAMKTARDFFRIAKEDGGGCEFQIMPDCMTGTTLVVSLRSDGFISVSGKNKERFCEIIQTADVMEVVQLTSCKFEINLSFNDAWKRKSYARRIK